MIDSDDNPSTDVTTQPDAPAPRAPFTERLSDSLQGVVKAVIGANRRPPRRLKSFLHGTYLGHPLHPALTDVPVGAWLLTVVFDVIWLVAPSGNGWAAQAALITAAAGVLGGLAAFATGIADWSDSYGAERSVGLLHGLLNTLAVVIFAVSVGLRIASADHQSLPAAILGFAGLAIMLYAAYLGGDMVFVKGTQVNHTAWEAGTDEYEPVLSLDAAPDNRLYRVTAGGVPVVLLRLGERFHAISATCSHAGGPLDEGTLEGDVVTCPWHGSRFSMRTGHVLTGPATTAQPRYDVRVRNGMIELKRLGGH